MARKKGPEKIEVPMSAMIDIVFLLLVFFVATNKPKVPEAHVAINLPAPSQQNPDKPQPQLLEVIIAPTEYYLNGKRRTLEALGDVLEQFGAMDPRTTVVIKVAPEAEEGNLIDVLDLCSEANLSQLNVMMLPY